MNRDERRHGASPPMTPPFDIQRFATDSAGKRSGTNKAKTGSQQGRRAASAASKASGENATKVTHLPRSRRDREKGEMQNAASAVAVPARRTPPVVDAEVEQHTVKYVVQPGDTLYRLARRFNTTTKELASLNNLHKPTLLFPGDVLLVPDYKG